MTWEWCRVAISKGLLRIGFTEKVTFEQRRRDEGVSQGGERRKNTQGEETSQCKGLARLRKEQRRGVAREECHGHGVAGDEV